MMDHIAEIKRRVATIESAGTGAQDAAGAAARASGSLGDPVGNRPDDWPKGI